MRARRAAAAAALVALAACGSREVRIVATPAAGPTSGAAAGTSTRLPDPFRDLAVNRAGGGAGDPRGSPSPNVTLTAKGFPLSLDVDPACVARGTAGVARVRTRPGAQLGFVVAFEADPEARGPFGFGEADPTGRYAWTFVIASDAPSGPARVLVAAGDWQRGGGGTARREFRVADAGAC